MLLEKIRLINELTYDILHGLAQVSSYALKTATVSVPIGLIVAEALMGASWDAFSNYMLKPSEKSSVTSTTETSLFSTFKN